MALKHGPSTASKRRAQNLVVQIWALRNLVRDLRRELQGAGVCITLWEHDRDRILAWLRETGHAGLAAAIERHDHL